MKNALILILALMLSVNLALSSGNATIEIGHFDFAGGPLVADSNTPLPDGMAGALFVQGNPLSADNPVFEFSLNGSSLFSKEGFFLSSKHELTLPSEGVWILLRIWDSADQETATYYWESPLTLITPESQQISFATEEWTLHPIDKAEASQSSAAVEAFALHPNYPNPFNAETTIGFDIAEATQVTIRLYDMLGREAARIMNAAYPVGSHTLSFDAAGLATGNYLLRMSTATGFQQVRRITLLK